jgi:hypothetical protein
MYSQPVADHLQVVGYGGVGCPVVVVGDGAPELLDDGAPELLEDGAPELLDDGAPELLDDGAPELLEDGAPELLEDGDGVLFGIPVWLMQTEV